jgi:hypothetical protein
MLVVARQDRTQERRHVLTLLLGRDQAWYTGTLGSLEPSTSLLKGSGQRKVEAGGAK